MYYRRKVILALLEQFGGELKTYTLSEDVSPPPPPGENPDDPCYIDPDEPMQLPPPQCLASPCNWPFPPRCVRWDLVI